jgi:hypothetical protein
VETTKRTKKITERAVSSAVVKKLSSDSSERLIVVSLDRWKK